MVLSNEPAETEPTSVPVVEPAPVLEPLSVTIGQPAEGANLPRKALVTVTANATDQGAAELLVNGVLRAELSASPYVFSFLTEARPQAYRLEVKVTTEDGRTGQAEVLCSSLA